MVSQGYAMQYFFHMCVTVYWDPSHGNNRDWWLSVDQVGLRPLMMLLLIVLNLPHGPDESDLRFNQLRLCMTEHYRLCNPRTSPIFQKFENRILEERGEDLQPAEGETLTQCLWRTMGEETLYRPKGYKVNIARWVALVGDGRQLLGRWTHTLFDCTVPAIEHNMIPEKALAHITLKVNGADVDSAESTSTKKVCPGDRTVRSCGANAVVMALMLLSEYTNRRLFAICISVATVSMHWAGHAARELRDVARSQAWLLGQLRRGLLSHVHSTLDILTEDEFTRVTGFCEKAAGQNDWISNEELLLEDEMANYAGLFALSHARNRYRRVCFKRG